MPFQLFDPSIKVKPNSKSNRFNSIKFTAKQKKLSIFQPVFKAYFNNANFIHLYYDIDEKLIGIKPAANEDDTTLKLQGESSKSLMIGKFLKRYNIKIEGNQEFDFTEQDGMLILKVG